MFVRISELCAWQNRAGRILRRNGGQECVNTAIRSADQMRGVEHWSNRFERVDFDATDASRIRREVWGESGEGEILLRRERAFGQIERDVFMEPPEVVIELGLALAEGINRHSETWRPV